MVDITKQQKEEILEIYKEKTDLFNWCEEYKQFISECVHCCVSSEWDYILKKSVEDGDAPFSYDELDLFDPDEAIEILVNDFDDEDKKEDFIALSNDPDTFNRRVKTRGDFEVFLNDLEKDEIKEVFENLGYDSYDVEAEVYEWWIISDPLAYRLEQQGQIMLNGAWGRQCTGQHISLDYSCIKAFLDYIKDLYRY